MPCQASKSQQSRSKYNSAKLPYEYLMRYVKAGYPLFTAVTQVTPIAPPTGCGIRPVPNRNLMQICGHSGLTLAMVPCLHQSIVNIKRKLGVWGALKCNPYFGAELVLPSTGQQTTRIHAEPYGTVNANLRKFGPTFRQCTVFAPKHC